MRGRACLLVWAVLPAVCALAAAQAAGTYSAKDYVWEAVRAELAADAADHTVWLYYEVDRKPGDGAIQWAADTRMGELDRILEKNGQRFSLDQQRGKMDAFIQNSAIQARQRKGGQHDDREAAQMLNLLPNAFLWTITRQQGGRTFLHFRPDPNFRPPTWESRVFAAMEGDMVVDDARFRIESLQGRMIRQVKFGWGLFGELEPGGTFDVERRQLAPGVWQITETHVHIQGHALIFKSISEQEDDVKSRFQQLPENITLSQAEEKLLAQP
ncbi:MAG: hypothetical protein ACLGP3_12620 [Acidobacteriota bacterium]